MFHPSGGLIYHLRAWRYRQTLWAPFHHHVLRWLTDWRPHAEHLVLVGPSGGYALSRPFLERFAQVSVIEPDALARHILRRRFPHIPFRFDPWQGLAQSGGGAELAARHAGACFLFCNLLGQELVGTPSGLSRAVWLAELSAAMDGRAWASWHELASTHRAPDHYAAIERAHSEPLEEVLAHFWSGGTLAIIDHGCAGLLPAQARHYAVWQLLPRQFHLIEWLCDATAQGDPPSPTPTGE